MGLTERHWFEDEDVPEDYEWDLEDAIKNAVPVIRCKDCKYYCVKDFWADFHGVPVLAANDVPTCNRWANTESKVDPNGFCFLAEKMDGEKVSK
jgi:hypothetical protein